MITKVTAGFINELMDQVIRDENEMATMRVRLVECATHGDDIERKLTAAQENLFSVQRKLYDAVMLINYVYMDYRDLNFKTKSGRKRADHILDQMRDFKKKYDIHIESTEKGMVAK